MDKNGQPLIGFFYTAKTLYVAVCVCVCGSPSFMCVKLYVGKYSPSPGQQVLPRFKRRSHIMCNPTHEPGIHTTTTVQSSVLCLLTQAIISVTCLHIVRQPEQIMTLHRARIFLLLIRWNNTVLPFQKHHPDINRYFGVFSDILMRLWYCYSVDHLCVFAFSHILFWALFSRRELQRD